MYLCTPRNVHIDVYIYMLLQINQSGGKYVDAQTHDYETAAFAHHDSRKTAPVTAPALPSLPPPED